MNICGGGVGAGMYLNDRDQEGKTQPSPPPLQHSGLM